MKDIHNKSTLAALGHTVESIKLPPEKRDRKRKTDGKVGGLGDRNGNGRGEGNKPAQANGSKSAQERVGCEVRRQGSEATGGQQGEIGAPSTDVRRVTGELIFKCLSTCYVIRIHV